jgi:hypothetical protein
MLQKCYKTVVSLALVWHFSGILIWLSPANPLQEQLIGPFVWYLNYFGLWQSWALFVSPHMVNYYMTAMVKFRDGTVQTWEFPRPEKMGYLERMFKERYRQWGVDALNSDAESYLRPDAARYIARLHNTDPNNPPVRVCIIRHWTYIPPPEEGLGKPLPAEEDGQEVIFDTDVQPGDLS